jgi:TRAP transporter TAXI family solute receptor
MRLSRSGLRTLLACGLALLGACSGGQEGDAGPRPGRPESAQVTIGSNPAGTHVYAVAGGLAKVLQEGSDLRATVRPFSGSSVYLPLLQRGEISLGLNTSIDSYLAYQGLPPYPSRMDHLRLLGEIFPLPIMYMVRADSDLREIEDLRGKRVVITFRANAALAQLHRAILATGGLTEEDVEPLTVAGLPDAMRMLTEGRADAVPTGLDTALVLQVDSAVSGGIRYLTMGRDEAKLAEGMPGASVLTVMPNESSVGLDGPTKVANVVDFLNTSAAMSDDLAYLIVKTIHDNWTRLRRDYVQMRSTSAEMMAPADAFHPYHAGAIRYYKEIGLWTDAHERNQQRLLALE